MKTIILFIFFCTPLSSSADNIKLDAWNCSSKESIESIHCEAIWLGKDLPQYNDNQSVIKLIKIENKIKNSINMKFSGNCSVSKIIAYGVWNANNGNILGARVMYNYECKESKDNLNISKKYLIKTEATRQIRFDCANTLFWSYESGFEIFNDGSRMHWDSQGTSQQRPWRIVQSSDTDSREFNSLCDLKLN
jgi:hypothetical protein